MGKKGVLTSVFSRLVVVDDSPAAAVDDSPAAAVDSASPPPWPWPSCRNPQTTSFRADDYPCSTAAGGTRCGSPAGARLRRATSEMYETVNSVYFDSADESCFDHDEEEDVLDDDRFSTTTASEERSEAVIRSLSRTTSTDRFFFDPGPPINSILAAASAFPARTPPAEAKAKLTVSNDNDEKLLEPYSSKSLVEERVAVAVAVDSEDPYRDFRASMEEMVAAHGLRGWEALEELLVWYLRVNAKHNHALIVGAFVDLLVGLATTSPSTAATTTTTTATTSSSSSSASTSSSTSTSTTSDGGGVTRRTTRSTTTAAAMERCGGGNEASASCSSSSCVTSDQDEAGEKASDHTRN